MTAKIALHSITCMIMGFAHNWAFERNLVFRLTSVVSEEKRDVILGRVSASHREGRAFDISIRGWTTDDIDDFREDLQRKFGQYGAVSLRDNVRRLVVVKHDHIHVQISKAIATAKNEKLLSSLCEIR